MKGIFQGQQAPLGLVAIIVLGTGEGSSQLERALPGLGATVAEKCFVQARYFGQPLRQLRLVLMKKQVRDVNQPSRLTFQGRLNHGMRVSQGVDPNPAEKVEIAFALRIPQINAASALEQHALAIVSGKQQFGLGTRYGGEAHATITSVPPSSLVR